MSGSLDERDLLGQAAAELARNPRASTETLARACGISRATLNRKFASRRALLEAIARDALDRVDEIAAETPETESAADYLRAILESLIVLGDRFRVMDQDPDIERLPEIQKRLEKQRSESTELARALKAEGDLDPAVPDAFFTAALDGLLFSAWAAIADGSLALRDAPALIHRTLLRGLQPPPNSPADNKRSKK
ncbi:MAG: TetR/AcrR family transcriptional regulator [bacterium]|nr:TetR/AcrR family transcriptional regulator [bacterium]